MLNCLTRDGYENVQRTDFCVGLERDEVVARGESDAQRRRRWRRVCGEGFARDIASMAARRVAELEDYS